MSDYDVIVVGAGNAAQAAAMSALENGAKKVAILEKANEDNAWRKHSLVWGYIANSI